MLRVRAETLGGLPVTSELQLGCPQHQSGWRNTYPGKRNQEARAGEEHTGKLVVGYSIEMVMNTVWDAWMKDSGQATYGEVNPSVWYWWWILALHT